MQALTIQLGGKVEATSKKREYGFAKVCLHNSCALFNTLQDNVDEDGKPTLDVWMSHSDKIQQVPESFITVGSTDTCEHAAMCNEERRIYGIQFHPEVTHTKQGVNILQNFIIRVCKCETIWKCESIIDDIVQKIRNQVHDDRVMLALSGGVDSSTTALLLQKAVGENLLCIFVDNGLLRLNEADQVMHMFKDKFGLRVIRVDAQDRFFVALAGVSDPEKKRKVIGNIFIDVFTEKAKEFDDIKWLSQGTIYPDVIESASSATKKAEVIKSHHNVAGLPDNMSLKLIEPLRELFKDEIRKIGLALGLPPDMIYRHPFPGPGLGVRILGELKKEYCDILRLADAIFIEELRQGNLYDKVSQAFAVFLPVRSVSVMGDQRKYDWVIALRAVETIDFMTATWSELPHAFLAKVSNRIMNEVQGISRVVYDISGKPPSTIEWE